MNDRLRRGLKKRRTWSDFHSRPDEVAIHEGELAKWRQGDILTNLPLTWVAPSGFDSVTGSKNNSKESDLHKEEVMMPLGIICTQTCDIAGADGGLQHPFILVAPLIRAEDLTGKVTPENATSGQVGYLFPVPVPDEQAQGTKWFADFRMMFPVSKALLARLPRLPDRLDDQLRLRFAESLAFKLRRTAASDVISYHLPKSLAVMVKSNQNAHKEGFRLIEQIRVAITDGTRDLPSTIQLFVVASTPVTQLEMDSWRPLTQSEKDLWHTWEKAVKTEFMALGVRIGQTLFTSPQDMNAEEYRNTVFIKVKGIGTEIFW